MPLELIFPEVDFSGVRGVMLDLDNTLYAYNPVHQHALDMCADRFAFDFGSISKAEFKICYRAHRDQVTKRLAPQGACRSRLLAFQGVFEELGIRKGWLLAKEYADLYWASFIRKMEIDPGAQRFLDACVESSVPICLVTDMEVDIQVLKLQRLGLEDRIDFVVSSHETGKEKPDAVIFAAAFDKLRKLVPDLKVGECIMIGDSEEKDIGGAQHFGVEGYLVQCK